MDYPYDDAVSAVLLGYSALSKTQRDVFVKCFNEFQFVSPQRQRRIAGYLLTLCRNSSDPSVQQIAESAATYIVEMGQGRKPPEE
jgi:hypothetical protein